MLLYINWSYSISIIIIIIIVKCSSPDWQFLGFTQVDGRERAGAGIVGKDELRVLQQCSAARSYALMLLVWTYTKQQVSQCILGEDYVVLTWWRGEGMACLSAPAHGVNVGGVSVQPDCSLNWPAIKVNLHTVFFAVIDCRHPA